MFFSENVHAARSWLKSLVFTSQVIVDSGWSNVVVQRLKNDSGLVSVGANRRTRTKLVWLYGQLQAITSWWFAPFSNTAGTLYQLKPTGIFWLFFCRQTRKDSCQRIAH